MYDVDVYGLDALGGLGGVVGRCVKLRSPAMRRVSGRLCFRGGGWTCRVASSIGISGFRSMSRVACVSGKLPGLLLSMTVVWGITVD